MQASILEEKDNLGRLLWAAWDHLCDHSWKGDQGGWTVQPIPSHLYDGLYNSSLAYIFKTDSLVRPVLILPLTQRHRENAVGGGEHGRHCLQLGTVVQKNMCTSLSPSLVLGSLLNGAIPRYREVWSGDAWGGEAVLQVWWCHPSPGALQAEYGSTLTKTQNLCSYSLSHTIGDHWSHPS